MLECSDGSLYCGVTTDPDRRLSEHNGSPRGAKYTRSRRPVRMVLVVECRDRSHACRVEAAFKALPRVRKLECVRAGQFPEVSP